MNQNLSSDNNTIRTLQKELHELKQAFESLKINNETDSLQKAADINDLKESEKYFRNLYQNAPINYQSLDSNDCFIDVNPTWLTSMGYTRDEVIGHPFTDFMTQESAELVKTRFPNFLQTGEIRDFEFEMIRKDGTQLYVNFHGKISLSENGKFKQIHCFWTDISSRKQTEDSNRIKDRANESALNAIAISDLQGILTYVNPAFIKLWSYESTSEVLGKPATGFWQNQVQADEVIGVIRQNGDWFGEMSALNKNGETFDVQISAGMVKDSAGKPICMLASFADISQSKNAAKIRTTSETSYRELFDNVADAIYIQDKEGTFLDVNKGAVKMYGYPRETLVGKNPLFVSAPGKNDLAAIAELIEKAFNGEPQQFEFWGRRSNGEVFPKEVRIINATYFGEKVNIAIAQDITERKKSETALLNSERRFRELIELAVDGILIGSPEGIIVEANSYMQRLTGRSLKVLIGRSVSELFNPESLKNKPLRYDLLKQGKTVFSERDILRPDGKIIPVEMHTKMMPDDTYQSIFRDVTERKKAEEKLRQSEEKYKSLVESTSDIIWETDADGLYTYLSPQFETILGYKTDETIGKSPYNFISTDLIYEFNARMESRAENTEPFYLLVNKFSHRDGHSVYFETSGVPVHDENGNIKGYRGISRDITKRYLAEKELHKLSTVVQQSPNSIIITNLDGEIEYVNPSGCQLTGYSLEELIGKKTSIFKSGETPDNVYQLLWQTIIAGKEWKGIFCNKKKNGEYYHESASILPVKDTEGKITHYLAIKEDISQRMLAETALKESEERYRKLFEASPDAIILADIETGMLIDANAAACVLLGRSPDEIRQMHQSMIHPPRVANFSVESFRQHAEKPLKSENLQPIENSILRSDGSEVHVEVLASMIILNGRQILQGVFRNISDRKKAQEELLKAKEKAEASDTLKSAFLQNITHELRTPLNGIIGFGDMITSVDSTLEDRIEFNKMIKKSSTRLLNTITSYMDISMLVAGMTEVNKHEFSLLNFLNRITEQTIEQCNSRNLQLDIIKKAPDKDIQIITDEILLTKIFTHLLDNAIKFTREGSITISYETKDDMHHFAVSDTGAGISGEILPEIFEIFSQADLSASREFEGSGLGLSIVRGFVKLLGGEIWVQSTKNEGSTFSFTLPASKSISDEINSIKKSAHPEQPIVLVAEDDDSNYKYVEIVLKRASFKVLRSHDGFETVEICRNLPNISILLTDMKMPGMDGLESTRLIREILPHLPIIALSGLISSEDEEAARRAGCNDYIIKPISKIKLLKAIDRLLNQVNY